MPDRHMDCPRCKSRMEEGYVVDHGHGNSLMEQKWIEGPPETSFWSGLQTKDRELFKVSTYRCEQCGYLESYATMPTKA